MKPDLSLQLEAQSLAADKFRPSHLPGIIQSPKDSRLKPQNPNPQKSYLKLTQTASKRQFSTRSKFPNLNEIITLRPISALQVTAGEELEQTQ
jgi:hypothetical protein